MLLVFVFLVLFVLFADWLKAAHLLLAPLQFFSKLLQLLLECFVLHLGLLKFDVDLEDRSLTLDTAFTLFILKKKSVNLVTQRF